jgi:hypothetical protein
MSNQSRSVLGRLLGVVVGTFGMVGLAVGEPAGKPVMRDAATQEQLVAILRNEKLNDPMKKMEPAAGGDPSVVNRPRDLLSESDILCFDGIATLVPKRAILLSPQNLADRVGFKPGSKILSWVDFYAKNRGWITTVEVSRTQAEGNLALPEETQKQMAKCGNLVVATYQGGPISVLPPKVPEPKVPEPTVPAAKP